MKYITDLLARILIIPALTHLTTFEETIREVPMIGIRAVKAIDFDTHFVSNELIADFELTYNPSFNHGIASDMEVDINLHICINNIMVEINTRFYCLMVASDTEEDNVIMGDVEIIDKFEVVGNRGVDADGERVYPVITPNAQVIITNAIKDRLQDYAAQIVAGHHA